MHTHSATTAHYVPIVQDSKSPVHAAVSRIVHICLFCLAPPCHASHRFGLVWFEFCSRHSWWCLNHVKIFKCYDLACVLSLSGSLLPSLPLSLLLAHTRHVTCCLPGTAIPIAASTRIRDTSHAARATQTWQHCFRAPFPLSLSQCLLSSLQAACHMAVASFAGSTCRFPLRWHSSALQFVSSTK